MIQKVESELARAQTKKEANLKQQELDLSALNWYNGKLYFSSKQYYSTLSIYILPDICLFSSIVNTGNFSHYKKTEAIVRAT